MSNCAVILKLSSSSFYVLCIIKIVILMMIQELKRGYEAKIEMTSKLQKRDIEKLEMQQQQELRLLEKQLRSDQVSTVVNLVCILSNRVQK